MATLLQDVRFAVRILRKSPAFALVAIITLALAIGANTAVYSVVKAVLLAPLPFPDADRLVQINEYSRVTGQERDWIPYLDALDFQRDARSFEKVGDYRYALLNSSEGAGLPEALYGLQTTSELLPALGVSPALGRFFRADETRLGHQHVIILSDELWRRRFAADREIVGRTIHLNAEPYLVIGIMPPGFNFPLKLATRAHLPSRQMQYWIPMALDPAKQHRADDSTVAIARLKPGVTLEQAQAEMDALGARLAQLYPDTHDARRFRLQPLHDQVVGEIRPVLLVLFAAVAFVLLIAGANLANLLLARNTARQREMAIRLAIGAGPLRALRQRLTENLVLAIIGGGIGLVAARLGLNALLRLVPQSLPRITHAHVDLGVLAFAAGLTVVTGLIFGFVPALHAARSDPQQALKDSATTLAGRAHNRGRKLLVVSEVALAVLLTVGAGLLIKSLVRVLETDPGFHTDHVLVAVLVPSDSQYPALADQHAFFRRVLDRLKTVPGIEAAAAATAVPMTGQTHSGPVVREDHARDLQNGRAPIGLYHFVTPGYFQTMQIPLLSGRLLADADESATAPNVVVINQTAARVLWPGDNPIGKRLAINDHDGKQVWRQVVGVVPPSRNETLDERPYPEIYAPLEQGWVPANFVLLRTAPPPMELAPLLRREVAAVDPQQPVFLASSMDDLVSDSIAQRRFSVAMLVLFGVLALLLAAVGIYGVISYSVSQREHEIGVRIALGATNQNIGWLLLRQGLVLTAGGLAIGIIASVALTPLLQSLLYETGPRDLTTMLVVCTVLAAVALFASFAPARRAARTDPMVALRHE